MEIHVHGCDKFRLSCDSGKNFIDINGLFSESGIAVDSYPHFHYIEMREKEGQIRTFYFKNKGIKKDLDLGWWVDAEVIFSKNNVRHK